MDTSTSNQPVHYSEEAKQQHVGHWQTSGQSKKSYSDSQGLPYGTFKRWVARYHQPKPGIGQERTSNFVSLDLKSSSGASAGYAKIHYPNGSKLIIHKPLPIEELRRLLL